MTAPTATAAPPAAVKGDPNTDEAFTLLAWQWDVAAARTILDGRPVTEVDVRDAPVMFIGIDEAHWPTVDLTDPIIVGWTPATSTGERSPLPLDGWHRIRKALEQGRSHLPARVLTPEESDACLISRPRRPRRSRPR